VPSIIIQISCEQEYEKDYKEKESLKHVRIKPLEEKFINATSTKWIKFALKELAHDQKKATEAEKEERKNLLFTYFTIKREFL